MSEVKFYILNIIIVETSLLKVSEQPKAGCMPLQSFRA